MPKSDRKSCGVFQCAALFMLFFTLGGSLAAEEIAYDAGKRRDPFVPLNAEDISSAADASGIKLEGIIYDPGGQSMAILSGKTYQRGQTVGDATVLRIQKNCVVLSVSGEEKTLWIRKEEKT